MLGLTRGILRDYHRQNDSLTRSHDVKRKRYHKRVKPDLEPRLQQLVKDIGGVLEHISDNGAANFTIRDNYLKATLVTGTDRVELAAMIGFDAVGVVEEWIERQPQPPIGRLRCWWNGDPETNATVALTFWRPLVGHDWRHDPLGTYIHLYTKAWEKDRDVSLSRLNNLSRDMVIADPISAPPANAWLLIGSDDDAPAEDDLEEARSDAAVGEFWWSWTASKQTLEGDLLLFYFMSPAKEVRYVARAASSAYFDNEALDGEEGQIKHKWWVSTTPPVEIEPIPYQEFQSIARVLMRGGGGKYLRPEVIEQLAFTPKHLPDAVQLSRILQRPVGLPDVPGTAAMTFEAWRAVAGGAFKKEADVTRHVVLPLLRWIMPEGVTVEAEYPVGRARADIVLLSGDQPVLTVEVKLAINLPPDGNWRHSPDLDQLKRRYVDHLRTPGLLVDANRIAVVPFGHSVPSYVLERAHFTEANLDSLRDLLANGRTRV